MNNTTLDFYQMPTIGDYEDLHLLTLSENCARLEEQLRAMAETLPEHQRQLIADYIGARDDLEVETFKAALRWGKRHCL